MNDKKKLPPLLLRASFWNLVSQALQIALGTVQTITLANERLIQDYNIWLAVGQNVLGIMGIFTRDTNRDDIIDVAQPEVLTTVEIKSTGPVDVDVSKKTIEPPEDEQT